jgi:hypothetical protein
MKVDYLGDQGGKYTKTDLKEVICEGEYWVTVIGLHSTAKIASFMM